MSNSKLARLIAEKNGRDPHNTRGTVRRWLRGTQGITVRNQKILEEIFGKPVGYFMDESPGQQRERLGRQIADLRDRLGGLEEMAQENTRNLANLTAAVEDLRSGLSERLDHVESRMQELGG